MTIRHGFVDESIRAGCYRLTLVLVPTTDLTDVNRAVRATILPGQYRVHISSDRPARQRAILRSYASLDIEAIVYETPYRRGDDDRPARDRCLRALIRDVGTDNVGVLVFDTRGPDRDHHDRSTIARELRAMDRDWIAYSHRGSRDEVLLSLPDAVGWAIGRGGRWFELVAQISTTRSIAEGG